MGGWPWPGLAAELGGLARWAGSLGWLPALALMPRMPLNWGCCQDRPMSRYVSRLTSRFLLSPIAYAYELG
jgi:hypothetical protein